MKKKLLAMFLSAAMIAGILGGCGNSGSGAQEEAPSAQQEAESEETGDGEQTEAPEQAEAEPETQEETAEVDPASVTGEITYWSFTDYANNLVKEFNEVYPNVTVDLQVFGGDEYKTKILTALQSQDGVPDMFDLEEGYIYEFLDSDLIADLSYMNIDELTKDYYEFQRASMKDSKGNFKSLLFQSSPVALWYLRDACEEWLGTSDPDEISAMLSDWDTIIAKGEEVYEKSGGEVCLWPNMSEMVKVNAFSFDPLVRDGKLEITDDWINLIDNMRKMNDTKANADLGAWSSEWATAWNEGKLLFRAMPSWDFFTDWDANKGNVGVAAPFDASYEGGTGVCVYNNSDKKELAALFLTYIASDDFQKVNMENYNQIPASKPVCDELAENFSAEDFGGQNLLATYSVICDKIAGITPDKYTRPTQNLFAKVATDGIKEGQDNDTIIENFKKELHDKYPEVVID